MECVCVCVIVLYLSLRRPLVMGICVFVSSYVYRVHTSGSGWGREDSERG